jgi:hypothetical protein
LSTQQLVSCDAQLDERGTAMPMFLQELQTISEIRTLPLTHMKRLLTLACELVKTLDEESLIPPHEFWTLQGSDTPFSSSPPTLFFLYLSIYFHGDKCCV